MLRVSVWEAPGRLAGHVARIWRMSGEGGGEDWLLPDVGGAEIAVHLGDPGAIAVEDRWAPQPERVVVGALGRALAMRHGRAVETFGVQLAPGCACLLGARAAELRGAVLPLRAVASRLDAALAAWADRARLGRAGAADLVHLVEGHTDGRCDPSARRAAAALGADDAASWGAIAGSLGYSRRHLTRRFEAAVGIAPRDFARVARFARAARAASRSAPGRWAAIAAEAGYADQPHLVREFRALTGLTPTALFPASWYASFVWAERMSPPFKPAGGARP